MKTIIKLRYYIIIIFLVMTLHSNAQNGYNPGDIASDFRLKSTDGKMVSLKDFPDARGFIIIFSCNHCPYVKAYEDRMIEINNKYSEMGYPVIAINSNDPEIIPEDSYENMQKRAKEKGYTFPYLFDEQQEVYKIYGATRTPHVFLLVKNGKDLKVAYIGAIDDNYQDPDAVKVKYLENALAAVMEGKNPDPDFTKAIGCTIKYKQ